MTPEELKAIKQFCNEYRGTIENEFGDDPLETIQTNPDYHAGFGKVVAILKKHGVELEVHIPY